jgi:hypothetical protein
VEVNVRLSDSDADKVLSGQVPADRGDLESVAAFLSELHDTYPPAEVGPARDEHLFAITREARIVAAAPPPRHRRSTRRLVVSALAASVGVLTMGVGVAAAVGANPLSFLPNLLPEPAISARVDTPASVPAGSAEPSDRPGTPKPTSQPGTPAPQSTAKSDNGKSDEARSEHSPTAKPSDKGKSDEAKSEHKPSDKGGSGKGGADKGGSDKGGSDKGKSDEAKSEHKPVDKPEPRSSQTTPPGKSSSTR